MSTLDFKGKQIVYAHHLTVSLRPLEIDAEKSFSAEKQKPSLDGNLIIHGDNLHALKALMPRYANRVNCIYIDPPYNTGNEKWLYNDNVNSPMMQTWLADKSPVDGEDLERHDKWLCMMWPRLQLLRELLAEDGVIFISIDDNEQHRLRMMMDEIFGEENFIASMTVRNNPGGRDYGGIALTHDYVVVYAKSYAGELNPIAAEESNLPLQDEQGNFALRELRNRNIRFNSKNRPNLYYPFYVNTKTCDNNSLYEVSLTKNKGWIEVYPLESGGVNTVWRWQKTKAKSVLNTDVKAKQKRDGNFQIIEKYRNTTKRERSILYDKEFRNEQGTLSLKSIFNSKNIFDYPKSDSLIKRIVELGGDKNTIILDSFAGSGTTAHAVLALNKEDGGKRKFILVECENYANKITAERVRRVIKGVQNAKDENLKNGLGGSFSYCTLGDEVSIEKMLTGKNLPDYETLARYLVYTATGQSPEKIRKACGKDGFFHEAPDRLLYLVYEPNITFLRSTDSALNSDRAERIAKQAKTKKKTALVFATHKFMGQKELTDMNITFCQLPYTLRD